MSELVEVLEELGFELHWLHVECHRPKVLIGAYRWAYHADVVVMVDEQHAHAYRLPTWMGNDLLAPRQLFWHRQAGAVRALRAMLALPPPGHPADPAYPLEPPNGCGQLVCSRLPRGWRP